MDPNKFSEYPMKVFTQPFFAYAPWLASCITESPMPASPKPITNTITSKAEMLVTIVVKMRIYGTKYSRNIKMVFITISLFPWRVILLDLKYSFTLLLRVTKKSFLEFANFNAGLDTND